MPVAAFANVLVSMRDMVQELATLVMHFTDLALKTLSILVNSNSMTVIQNAKEQAYWDYNEIRRIAQPGIVQVSDILMDMVFFVPGPSILVGIEPQTSGSWRSLTTSTRSNSSNGP